MVLTYIAVRCAGCVVSEIDFFLAWLMETAKQEDDEVVLQIVYLFHQFVAGGKEEIREEFMGKFSDAIHYMIDLMHDANSQICKLCDATLDVVAVRKKKVLSFRVTFSEYC